MHLKYYKYNIMEDKLEQMSDLLILHQRMHHLRWKDTKY